MRYSRVFKTLQERFGDPIGSYAGDAPVGVRSQVEVDVCSGCGMMPIGGKCGCEESCGCGAPGGECTCDMGVCPACGMIPIQGVANVTEGTGCAECGMTQGTGCSQCGMTQGSGCTHERDVEEVAPKGYERVVKALKKEPEVDNPWAVAWSMQKKGIRPKKRQ